MRDWIFPSRPAGLTGKPLMRSIVQQVAAEYQQAERDIMSTTRRASVAAARMEAYARIRATKRFSYPQIGAFFNRDHSTVVHGVKRALARALAEREAA